MSNFLTAFRDMLDFEFLLFVIILKFTQYRDQKALKATDYNQQNEEER